MGRRVRFGAACAVVLLAPAGCSLLLRDDLAGAAASMPDAAEERAPPSADPADASESVRETAAEVDAGDAGDASEPEPNDLTNAGFEMGSCASWSSEFATLETTEIAHDGSKGCLVCSVAGHEEAQLYQIVSRPIVPDVAYVGELWVRAHTIEPVPPDPVELEIDVRAGAELHRGVATPSAKAIDDEWQRVVAALSTTAAGDAVQLFLHFPAAARYCVVVDGARLYRTN